MKHGDLLIGFKPPCGNIHSSAMMLGMLDSLRIQVGSRLERPVSVAKKDTEFQKRNNYHEGRLREDRTRVGPRGQSPMKGKEKAPVCNS